MYETEKRDRVRRAILAGVNIGNEKDFEVSMNELEGLAESAGLFVVLCVEQKLAAEDSAYYIGSGKVTELKGLVFQEDADLVVVNNTLSPSQLANLSHDLGVEVIDRTNLILNIFADRARTREAKMQVDYAKLQYMLPRLQGLRQNLSRQGGTGGSMSNKGSGEKQIELDRRHIEKQMAELRRELKEIEESRMTQRKRRLSGSLPLVSLVGYTNAGKSTVMNGLLKLYGAPEEKKVLVQNQLFATLDTTVRKISAPDHAFLLSDTVGFISELPHDLVDAFHSTLEEARYADLLLEVVDYSDPGYEREMAVTDRTLQEIGAGAVPRLYVMNKAELKMNPAELPRIQGDRIFLSALTDEGLKALTEAVQRKLSEERIRLQLLIPYKESACENDIRNRAFVVSAEYRDDGVLLTADLTQEMVMRYKRFIQ